MTPSFPLSFLHFSFPPFLSFFSFSSFLFSSSSPSPLPPSLFCFRQTSTPPEEEEINLHSYFLLRAKECTGLHPWAPFPSLPGSSVAGVKCYAKAGKGLVATLCALVFLYVVCVTSWSCPCSPESCVYSECGMLGSHCEAVGGVGVHMSCIPGKCF